MKLIRIKFLDTKVKYKTMKVRVLNHSGKYLLCERVSPFKNSNSKVLLSKADFGKTYDIEKA